MDTSSILFYAMSAIIVASALSVVLTANPIFSALFLSVTMVLLAFVFFLLEANFIAGVQLIVYAGAVMVLFVMVVMLFDLKKEKQIFSKGRFTGFVKIASAGWLCGLISATAVISSELIETNPQVKSGVSNFAQLAQTKNLAQELFTKYLFAFEALGILLLLVAVGVVALSRSKGGTHAS